MTYRTLGVLLCATATAAACGSGGGGSDDDVVVDTVDARPPGPPGEVCDSAEPIALPGGSTMIRASTTDA